MIYNTYSIGGILYHHGIAGQKWGKRNGPPYPLKPNAHSVAEKKKNPSIATKHGGSADQDKTYRENEASKTKKYYRNTINKKERKIEKIQNKMKNNKEQYREKLRDLENSQNTRKNYKSVENDYRKVDEKYLKKDAKLKKKLDKQQKAKEYVEKVMNKELSHIKLMDVKQDKINKGMHYAKNALISAGGTILGTALLGPSLGIRMYYFYMPRYERTTSNEKEEIRQQVYNKKKK